MFHTSIKVESEVSQGTKLTPVFPRASESLNSGASFSFSLRVNILIILEVYYGENKTASNNIYRLHMKEANAVSLCSSHFIKRYFLGVFTVSFLMRYNKLN